MSDQLRKAAQIALDALETKGEHHERVYAAIEALRQALADQKLADAFAEDFPNTWGKKKHTAPPSKPWVSLTDEELEYIYKQNHNQYGEDITGEYERELEAKLREKNT